MDLHEHGISAYPEYVISAIGVPAGMEQELPLAQSPREFSDFVEPRHQLMNRASSRQPESVTLTPAARRAKPVEDQDDKD